MSRKQPRGFIRQHAVPALRRLSDSKLRKMDWVTFTADHCKISQSYFDKLKGEEVQRRQKVEVTDAGLIAPPVEGMQLVTQDGDADLMELKSALSTVALLMRELRLNSLSMVVRGKRVHASAEREEHLVLVDVGEEVEPC